MIELFAVRNAEGKWFRARGYGGYGDAWVDELKNAKLYARIGQARGRVTFFAANWPQHGIPSVVRLVAREAAPIPNETERAKAAIAKKERREEEREVRQHAYRVEAAQRDLARAKATLAAERQRKGARVFR